MWAPQGCRVYACMFPAQQPTYSEKHKHGCSDIERIVVCPVVSDQQVLRPVRAVLELLYQARVLVQVEVWHRQYLYLSHALVLVCP